ncbi:MAG: hypothetical protein IPI60_04165 [Saprospiraceae bacterium]|nr:hypothetical protein [Saprospiraceae bacterium]
MTNWLLLISASTMMIFLQTCGRKSADSGTSAAKLTTSKTVIVYDSITNVVDTVRLDPPGEPRILPALFLAK